MHMQGHQGLSSVRSEINSLLSTIRQTDRWASEDRFKKEVPLQQEIPIIRALKELQLLLQDIDELDEIHSTRYLQPFLDVIKAQNTNAATTGAALASVNKFFLYGIVSKESPRAREAVNLAADAIIECKFESTLDYLDDIVLQQLLEVAVSLVRSPAGVYLTNRSVWRLIQMSFDLFNDGSSSNELLQLAAANTLSYIIMIVFSRAHELLSAGNEAMEKEYQEWLNQNDQQSSSSSSSSSNGYRNEYEGSTLSRYASDRAGDNNNNNNDGDDENIYSPYGGFILVQILQFLAHLTDPSETMIKMRLLGLQLLNIVLETGGEALSAHSSSNASTSSPSPTPLPSPDNDVAPPILTNQSTNTNDNHNQQRSYHSLTQGKASPIIAVFQGDLCKFLLLNSQTDDISVLSLTLRVVFNLFSVMKGFLKVQLEVFLTSVHLRIVDSPSASYEQKELALESMLDFCRDSVLMLDIYTNYDCDVRSANLFERMCQCLCRCAMPTVISVTGVDNRQVVAPTLNTLHILALEGILAIVKAISNRCQHDLMIGDTINSDIKEINKSKDYLLSIILRGGSSMLQKSPSQLDEGDNISIKEEKRIKIQESLIQNETDQANASVDNVQSIDSDKISDELGWFEDTRKRKEELLRKRKQLKRHLMLAAKQFNAAPNKQYWQEYAQDLEVLPKPSTSYHMAKFLFEAPGLDRVAVGEYISEPPDRRPFNALVLKDYVSLFDFKNMRIDDALRKLLESFRLPGEAQKISRIMEAFAERYYELSTSAEEGEEEKDQIFASKDAVYIFAYSIIMLHTDAHSKKIPKEKKMTLEQFVVNNRGINEQNDLPRSYLEEVYKGIQSTEMHMVYDPHAQSLTDTENGKIPHSMLVNSGSILSSSSWNGILKHSEYVSTASFTPSSLGRRGMLRAGIHEKDMFTILNVSTSNLFAIVFELTTDSRMVIKILEGYYDLAKIASYFHMTSEFNHIVITLCKFFTRTCGKGSSEARNQKDYPCLLLDSIQTEWDLAAIEAIRRAMVLSSQSDPSNQKVSKAIHRAELFASQPSCRAILAFRTVIYLTQTFGHSLREGWMNIVRCILALSEENLIPSSFIDIDDFVDSHGHRLPGIKARTSTLSQDDHHSIKSDSKRDRIPSSPRSITSNSMQQKQKIISSNNNSKNNGLWFAISSIFGDDGTNGSSSYVEMQMTLSLKQQASEKIQDILTACKLQNILTNSKHLEQESLVHFIGALSHPFLSVASQSQSLVVNHIFSSTELIESEMILCIEMITTIVLSNKNRVQLTWPVLGKLFREMLIAAGSSSSSLLLAHEDVDESSKDDKSSLSKLLIERVVVDLFRISIQYFDQEEDLTESFLEMLDLLSYLPRTLTEQLSVRVGAGVLSLIKANSSSIHGDGAWRIICRILDRYSRFDGSRDDVWEAIGVLFKDNQIYRANIIFLVDILCHYATMDDKYHDDDSENENGNIERKVEAIDYLSLIATKYVFSNKFYEQASSFSPSLTYSSTSSMMNDKESENKDIKSEISDDKVPRTPNLSPSLLSSSTSGREASWLLILIKLRSLLEINRDNYIPPGIVFDGIQKVLEQSTGEIPENLWLQVIEKILFPIVTEDAVKISHRINEGVSIDDVIDFQSRSYSIVCRMFLYKHDILISLAQSKGDEYLFYELWLRLLNLLGNGYKNSSELSQVQEVIHELLRNLLLVLCSPDNGVISSLSVQESTWEIIEAFIPDIRNEVYPIIAPKKEEALAEVEKEEVIKVD